MNPERSTRSSWLNRLLQKMSDGTPIAGVPLSLRGMPAPSFTNILRRYSQMEKDPNSQISNAGEHISPENNILGNMPSYEKHMREMLTPPPTEQDYANSERRENLSESELRNRFINEDYGKNGDILEVPSPLSSTGAIQARFRDFQEKWDEVEMYSRRDLSKEENLSELEKTCS